jgi:hypothetical protein
VLDDGVSDKRLMIYEPEFASVLRVARREGNTLSPLIREAWDTGTLTTLTRNAPLTATGAHVSIIGHITRDELIRHLDRTEAGNGFGNRFIWLCARRSKILPEGGHLSAEDLAPFVERLNDAVAFASLLGNTALVRDPEARALWNERYEDLSEGRPGLFGAVTSRAEAQVLRLSLIYALLDLQTEVKRVHLEAALEVWRYAFDSASFIFGHVLGDPLADDILRILRTRPEGLTRNEIRDLFARHRRAEDIGRALDVLQENGLARMERETTAGRPAERWHAIALRGAGADSAETVRAQDSRG